MSAPSIDSPASSDIHLPTGTVTFLFTDIEGSTALWDQAPESMQAALMRHNDVLRSAIEAHAGVVFKVVGDSFQAAFASAPRAVLAAVDGQRGLLEANWNELGPLRVRMGLHTGEAELDPAGDEYKVSHTKNRAARVMSAGHGGQILLSQETAVLVEREIEESIQLRDLGEHQLRGIRIPEHLYQVVSKGLLDDFPPLESLLQTPHNLPSQLTSFIGRESLIEQVVEMVAHNRLVSLTGTGGVGKTRLSLQVAERVLSEFPDGVWWVPLAPVSLPNRIPQTIADSVGLRLSGVDDEEDGLIQRLRRMHSLLLLDNCEHLVEACAETAANLLAGCPKLHLLITSREALNVPGENIIRVPALKVPLREESDNEGYYSLEELDQFEAVRLLKIRAQEAAQGMELANEDAQSLVLISQRLDGIPLGLELAAARLRVLSPAQVASRLDNRFRLLSGGSRTALPHHQTLRAAVDWSYQLLDPKEGLLFRRLSIFSGGWFLEAAEGICSGEFSIQEKSDSGISIHLEPYEILDLLASLVDKSLVQIKSDPGKPTRYYLLETLRQYAREKLFESGEAVALHRRHQRWFVQWVENGLPNQKNGRLLGWMNALEADFDDLRSALEWAYMDDRGPEIALRLSSALYRYWWIRGNFNEAVDWLNRGLSAAVPSMDELISKYPETALQRARAWYCLSWVVSYSNDEEARVWLGNSIDLYRNLGERGARGLVEALAWKATCYQLPQQSDQSFPLIDEAVDLARKLGPVGRWELGMVLWAKSLVNLFSGNLEIAQSCAGESWSLFLQVGDVWNTGPINVLGVCEMMRGNYDGALQYFHRALDRYLESGDNGGIANAYNNLTSLMFAMGDMPSAMHYFQEGAKIWQVQGNKSQVARYFKIMAFIRLVSVLAQPQDVVNVRLPEIIKLWSYAENHLQEFEPPITTDHFISWWDRTVAQVQTSASNALEIGSVQGNKDKLQTGLDHIGTSSFSQALTEGKLLSFNQALGSLSENY